MVRMLYTNAEYGDITRTSPEAFRVKISGFAIADVAILVFSFGHECDGPQSGAGSPILRPPTVRSLGESRLRFSSSASQSPLAVRRKRGGSKRISQRKRPASPDIAPAKRMETRSRSGALVAAGDKIACVGLTTRLYRHVPASEGQAVTAFGAAIR